MKTINFSIFVFFVCIFCSCSKEDSANIDTKNELTAETRRDCPRTSLTVIGETWDGNTACLGDELEIEANGLCEPITWVVQGAGITANLGSSIIIQLPTSPQFIWVEATGCNGCSVSLQFKVSDSGPCSPTSMGGVGTNCVPQAIADECYCRLYPYFPACDMQ